MEAGEEDVFWIHTYCRDLEGVQCAVINDVTGSYREARLSRLRDSKLTTFEVTSYWAA